MCVCVALSLWLGTHNQNIQVYESSSLNFVASLTGHIGIVTQLCASESLHGVYMFSASSDSTVQVSGCGPCPQC